MTRISMALAVALVAASAASSVAFAATSKTHHVRSEDSQTMAFAPGYQATEQDASHGPLDGGRAARSDYGNPWASHVPMSDGEPNGS
jgi:hypothetical protein